MKTSILYVLIVTAGITVNLFAIGCRSHHEHSVSTSPDFADQLSQSTQRPQQVANVSGPAQRIYRQQSERPVIEMEEMDQADPSTISQNTPITKISLSSDTPVWR